ncbi:MAG: LysM peptidoglycan-binding domain-containing protein [Phycisphaerales bacterium JB063]
MNASYKIALVVAVGLLIIVAGYYATRQTEAPATAGESADADQPTEVAALTDEPIDAPPQRTGGNMRDRSGPAVTPPRETNTTPPTARTPRSAAATPPPPQADPTDIETTTPPVVDLGPAPAGLPRSLADARNPGTNPASEPADAEASDNTNTPPAQDDSVATSEPTEQASPDTVTQEPAPATQPETTVDATPQTRPDRDTTPPTEPSRPAERPRFPSQPAERTADTRAIPATYTIQAGDMLVTIAERFYGSQAAWEAIAQANPSVDPTRLRVGQELRLPRPDAVDRPRTEPPAPTPGQRNAYTVQPGDNLYRIAQRFYNDAEKWDVIYNHNRDTIGDDPAKLREGMTLVIPPAVGGAN